MSKYDIYRWDVILASNGINKIPIIYIRPDIAFVEFVRANNYQVQVLIDGTNTPYDGHLISGYVNKSDFMPNFFDQTNLQVIVLNNDWVGYPDISKLGKASFYGLV